MRIMRPAKASRMQRRPPHRMLVLVRALGALLLVMAILARLPASAGHALPLQPALDAIATVDTTQLAPAVRLDPPPARPIGETHVYIIGDSLTIGVVDFGKGLPKLLAAGYQARVDGKVGRFISQGTTILQAEAAAGRLEPVVMVGLGTNEVYAGYSTAEISTNIDKLMAAVGDRWVIWVNVHMRDLAASDRFNRLIAAKALIYRHLLIADWRSVDIARYLQYDGVHLSAAGYAIRADFYVATLNNATLPH